MTKMQAKAEFRQGYLSVPQTSAGNVSGHNACSLGCSPGSTTSCKLKTCLLAAVLTVSVGACTHPEVTQTSDAATFELTVLEQPPVMNRSVGKQLVETSQVYLAQTEPDRERYADSRPSPVQRAQDEPVSTFSIDVDTGSYANVRRLLQQGGLPPGDAVRIEELVNYFDYDYPAPERSDVPFSVTTSLAPAPWNDQVELLRIGIQGQDVPADASRAANLVFLIDVSGSMASPDKLGLLTSSLSLLIRGLDAEDRVSIVTYAGAAGVVLDSAAGNDLATIDAALDQLQAGGATAGESGIETAYRLAAENSREDTVDRVILATDGDFNVGTSDVDSLLQLIEKRRSSGVALTTLGFGTGNYNDELMERLADAGNGHHAYIDTLSEAQKVLSQQLAGTLFTIAKDVKIQLEFNPAVVSEYRLIGYDNRLLAEEDFANDKVDAGDVGAGHSVTALYEITRLGKPGRLAQRRYGNAASEAASSLIDELGELRLRYKDPEGGESDAASKFIAVVLGADTDLTSLSDADEDFRFAVAVAAWGELLRDDKYLGDFSYSDVSQLARGARGDDAFGYRSAFLGLVDLAASLDDRSRLSRGALDGGMDPGQQNGSQDLRPRSRRG